MKQYKEWAASSSCPVDIPLDPARISADQGWSGMPDYLGLSHSQTANRVWRKFEDARRFVRKQEFKTQAEYRTWCSSSNRPADIPYNPHLSYANCGWIDWGDWLGTGRVATQNVQMRTFKEARDFAHGLFFLGKTEWEDWARTNDRPADIPANPASVYINSGWIDWHDWLGIMDYSLAKTVVKKAGINDKIQFERWAASDARPKNLPINPNLSYRGRGWVGWTAFFSW